MRLVKRNSVRGQRVKVRGLCPVFYQQRLMIECIYQIIHLFHDIHMCSLFYIAALTIYCNLYIIYNVFQLANGQLSLFSLVRVRFTGGEVAGSIGVKQVTGRQLAQPQPSPVRYTIGENASSYISRQGLSMNFLSQRCVIQWQIDYCL